MKKIFAAILMIPLLMLVLTGPVAYAQVDGSADKPTVDGSADKPEPSTGTTGSLVKLENPIKVNSIQALLLLLVDIAIYVGVSFCILAIIYVGFQFVMAQGNADKISEAKQWFFYIIIGLAILISSKVIVSIVTNTLIEAGVVDKKVISF